MHRAYCPTPYTLHPTPYTLHPTPCSTPDLYRERGREREREREGKGERKREKERERERDFMRNQCEVKYQQVSLRHRPHTHTHIHTQTHTHTHTPGVAQVHRASLRQSFIQQTLPGTPASLPSSIDVAVKVSVCCQLYPLNPRKQYTLSIHYTP